jgi:hypothetical protein
MISFNKLWQKFFICIFCFLFNENKKTLDIKDAENIYENKKTLEVQEIENIYKNDTLEIENNIKEYEKNHNKLFKLTKNKEKKKEMNNIRKNNKNLQIYYKIDINNNKILTKFKYEDIFLLSEDFSDNIFKNVISVLFCLIITLMYIYFFIKMIIDCFDIIKKKKTSFFPSTNQLLQACLSLYIFLCILSNKQPTFLEILIISILENLIIFLTAYILKKIIKKNSNIGEPNFNINLLTKNKLFIIFITVIIILENLLQYFLLNKKYNEINHLINEYIKTNNKEPTKIFLRKYVERIFIKPSIKLPTCIISNIFTLSNCFGKDRKNFSSILLNIFFLIKVLFIYYCI